jgi:hypothetical protein
MFKARVNILIILWGIEIKGTCIAKDNSKRNSVFVDLF